MTRALREIPAATSPPHRIASPISRVHHVGFAGCLIKFFCSFVLGMCPLPAVSKTISSEVGWVDAYSSYISRLGTVFLRRGLINVYTR